MKWKKERVDEGVVGDSDANRLNTESDMPQYDNSKESTTRSKGKEVY